MTYPALILALLAGLVLLVVLLQTASLLSLYVQATVSGVHVRFLNLVGMRLRKLDLRAVVNARIHVVRAGLDVPLADIEALALAGGNVQRVINAMIAANKANIQLPWKTAAAIDLAGQDVLQAVRDGARRLTQATNHRPLTSTKAHP